jgi:hypothetical protein
MRLPSLPGDRQLTGPTGWAADAFWLFVEGVSRWIRTNGGTIYGTNAQRTVGTTRGFANISNLADGTIFVETDTGLSYQLRGAAWVSLGGQVVTDQTLAAASTTINAPAAGSDWTAILRQDGTGGRAIVWGTGIKAASVAIDTTASTVSTFRFVKAGSDWVMAGQPTTGMAY